MAKNTVSDLFALIRAALGASPAGEIESDLASLYKLANAHDMAHLVALSLKHPKKGRSN